jgi:hypothetical protein
MLTIVSFTAVSDYLIDGDGSLGVSRSHQERLINGGAEKDSNGRAMVRIQEKPAVGG